MVDFKLEPIPRYLVVDGRLLPLMFNLDKGRVPPFFVNDDLGIGPTQLC